MAVILNPNAGIVRIQNSEVDVVPFCHAYRVIVINLSYDLEIQNLMGQYSLALTPNSDVFMIKWIYCKILMWVMSYSYDFKNSMNIWNMQEIPEG